MHSMVRHGMPLPKGISRADLSKMAELGDWNYHYQFLGKKVGRLTGGPFVAHLFPLVANNGVCPETDL